MIVLIDNYDSFTYNLYQYLGELGEVNVFRNDRITVKEIELLNPQQIVISPGPGRPEDTGNCLEIIKYFYQAKPILGICLGHQSIASVFGAHIVQAGTIYHGKTSLIYTQDSEPIFAGIENPFLATRYHSLIIEQDSLPGELAVIASTDDGEVMAIKHQEYPCYGLQFHPESILTESGKQLLKNFYFLS